MRKEILPFAAAAMILLHSAGIVNAASEQPAPSPYIAELMTLASEGDEKATYKLAEAYRLGDGIPRDYKRSLELFQSLADLGNVRAVERVAYFYARGRGVPLDRGRAIKEYRKAIAAGRDSALVGLGKTLVLDGQPTEALATLTQARDAGNEKAVLPIAISHMRGEFGTLSDPQYGRAELTRLSDEGNIDAMKVLADSYRRGIGVAQNYPESLALYQKLAEMGDARAIERVAYFYDRGLGVERDLEKAISGYRTAVDAGREYSRVRLAAAYLQLDRGEDAFEMLTLADKAGLDQARIELAKGHYSGDFGAKSKKKFGKKELLALAAKGNTTAIRFVLREVSQKRIFGVDIKPMLAALHKASEAGERSSTEALVGFYRKTPKSVAGARRLREKLISEYGAQMRPHVLTAEQVYLTIETYRRPQTFTKVMELLDNAPPAAFSAGLVAALRGDKGVYTYVVTKKLTELGYYRGRSKGLMTRRAINSIQKFCRSTGIYEICRHGPLRSVAAKAIGNQIAATLPQE